MEKGNLIEFRLQGERRLAVLDRPEGKKNWVVVDEQGPNSNPIAKQMSYCLDGQSYQPSDLAAFQSEVSTYLDPSSLEVAGNCSRKMENPSLPGLSAVTV